MSITKDHVARQYQPNEWMQVDQDNEYGWFLLAPHAKPLGVPHDQVEITDGILTVWATGIQWECLDYSG